MMEWLTVSTLYQVYRMSQITCSLLISRKLQEIQTVQMEEPYLICPCKNTKIKILYRSHFPKWVPTVFFNGDCFHFTQVLINININQSTRIKKRQCASQCLSVCRMDLENGITNLLLNHTTLLVLMKKRI